MATTTPLPDNWYGVFETTGGPDPVPLAEIHRTPNLDEAITTARQCQLPTVEVMKNRRRTLEWVPWRS